MTASSYPDLLHGIVEIVRQVCGGATAEKVTLDATFAGTLRIDGPTMSEIVSECDRRFGVGIPAGVRDGLETVRDVVDFVAAAGIAG